MRAVGTSGSFASTERPITPFSSTRAPADSSRMPVFTAKDSAALDAGYGFGVLRCVPHRWTCRVGAWVQLAGAPQIREKKRLLRNWQRANPSTTVNLGDRPGWASLKCFRASLSAASRLGRSRSAWRRQVRQIQANGESETLDLILRPEGKIGSTSFSRDSMMPMSEG
jgi:hypothetical protein